MKRFAVYIYVFVILFCSSCKKTIPQSKLPEIIAEIYLVDRYIGNIDPISSLTQLDSLRIYEPIFNKYGYTGEDYRRTIEKQISRPKKLKIYFEEAKVILEQRKEAIQPQVKEQLQRDSILSVYTATLNNNNAKYNHYKNSQNSKWLLFPYSDSRWPTGDIKTDIALPIERDLFEASEKWIATPLLSSYASKAKQSSSNLLSTAHKDLNLSMAVAEENPLTEDNLSLTETSTSEDNTSPTEKASPEKEHSSFSPFAEYNRKGYPIWLFPSETSTDTLRLGSSINWRVLFPNAVIK